MAETQETIADIIAEKRREADYIEETARGSLKAGENYDGIAYTESDLESALDLADTKRKEADRLEAAHKRECGDAAKLREALEYMFILIDGRNLVLECETTEEISGVQGKLAEARAALSAPPRNCDVGTAEEQSERFDKFCHANINTQRCCGDCPAFRTTRDDCELVWAQLPYEAKEGGAK